MCWEAGIVQIQHEILRYAFLLAENRGAQHWTTGFVTPSTIHTTVHAVRGSLEHLHFAPCQIEGHC